MRILLIIPCGHPAKLFEAAKEALNGVLLGVAGCVVSPRVTTLAPRRHHGASAAVSECGHQRGGIVGSVGHHERWGQALKQGQGLWRLMALLGYEAATPRSTAGLGGHMQLCGQAPQLRPRACGPFFCVLHLRASVPAPWWSRPRAYVAQVHPASLRTHVARYPRQPSVGNACTSYASCPAPWPEHAT